MKCSACGRRFGVGEKVLQSRQGEVACDNDKCTKEVEESRDQAEVFSNWAEYIYSEHGIESSVEISSVTLKRTKVRDVDGDTHEVPSLDFKMSMPAEGMDMGDVQLLHKRGLATIHLYIADLESV